MARPIKDTPVLKGKDARRFLSEISKTKPISKEEKTRQEAIYDKFVKMSVGFNW